MNLRLKTLLNLILAAAVGSALCLTTGCNEGHDHGQDHDHDHSANHDDHDGHDEDDDHGHGHDHGDGDDHGSITTGPNGGRVLMEIEPHLEFFVTDDKKVMITAVSDGEDPKAVPMGEQSVKVIAGDRLDPTRLAFAKDGDSLISDIALPDGMDIPVVVQIKATPDAKTVIAKFQANLKDCPTCDFKEYACACDHGHAHGDHDHGDHDVHVDAPTNVAGALTMIRDSADKVGAAEGDEAVDEAAAIADATIHAAAEFLESQKTAESANQKRLDGAIENLESIGHSLHDAAHDGKAEDVDKALKQLEGVLKMVERYVSE